MKGPATLETSRLILRPVTGGDLDDLVRLYGDPQVTAFTKLGRRDPDETAAILAGYREFWRRQGYGMHLVVAKADGRFLGECGLFGAESRAVEVAGEAALRYALFSAHWGQGLAGEAAGAVLRDGFDRAGLERIVSIAQRRNPASIRVMEKLGMTPVAPVANIKSDLVVYDIRKAAFPRAQKSEYPAPDTL